MNATKPEMSRTEASWHEHVAGMRARAAAKRQGGNPLAEAAFGSATAGPRQIGGFTVHPATEGTVWTLRRIAREFAAWANALGMPIAADDEPEGTREMFELGLSTLVFMDSRRVWTALDAGGLEDLIGEADALFWDVPLETKRELERFFRGQMDVIRDLSGPGEAPKKKSPEADGSGISPEMPSPPPVPPSPASNGFAPNTAPTSPMPSGGFP